MYEDKKKCVWMTSGLISYKLCAYDYLCEDCMFDRAMRNETAASESRQPADLSAAASLNNTSPLHIMDDYFYHRQHCWVRVENPECVKIGIHGILAKFLNRIKTVVLPQPGEALYQGQYFSHVIQHRQIIPIISPLTGSIHSVNHELEKDPELLINNFWENGWLVTIKPENLEHDLQTFIFGRRAVEWHKKKEHAIVEAGCALLNANAKTTGLTLQDGGEIIANFVDLLSSEQYYQIFESLSRIEETKQVQTD